MQISLTFSLAYYKVIILARVFINNRSLETFISASSEKYSKIIFISKAV